MGTHLTDVAAGLGRGGLKSDAFVLLDNRVRRVNAVYEDLFFVFSRGRERKGVERVSDQAEENENAEHRRIHA